MGPNLTVSTLNGKTKVKNSAGSPLRGGFAYNWIIRAKPPSERRTIQQKISALSENPLVAEYTRENLEIGLYAQTPVSVGLYSKRSAV